MHALPLVALTRVCKYSGPIYKRKKILSNVDMRLARGENRVILSLRDQGGLPLLNVIAGLSKASSGHVVCRGMPQGPITALYRIAPHKTLKQLTIFLARLYNADAGDVLAKAVAFSGLPPAAFEVKVGLLKSSDRARVSYAIGISLPADLYCFDQAIGIGDESFRARCNEAFEAIRRRSATIVITDNVTQVDRIADTASVLHKGRLHHFPTVAEAVSMFNGIKLAVEENAIAHLRTLIRLGEAHWMTQYLEQLGPGSVGAAEKFTILAELALQNKRYDDAIRAATSALEEGASRARLALVIAKAREALGDCAEAVRELQSIPEQDMDSNVKAALARNFEKLDEIGRAGVVWKGLAIEDDNLFARQRAEICLSKEKNWHELALLTEHTLSRDGDNLRALQLRFKALSSLRRWPETIPIVRKVAEQDIKKGVGLIYQAVQSDDWPASITLVKGLPLDRLSALRADRQVEVLIVLLKRRAAVVRKEGDLALADAVDKAVSLLASTPAPAPRIEDKSAETV